MDETASVIDYTDLLLEIIDNQQRIIEMLQYSNTFSLGSYNVVLVILGLSSALFVLLFIYNFLKKFI